MHIKRPFLILCIIFGASVVISHNACRGMMQTRPDIELRQHRGGYEYTVPSQSRGRSSYDAERAETEAGCPDCDTRNGQREVISLKDSDFISELSQLDTGKVDVGFGDCLHHSPSRPRYANPFGRLQSHWAAKKNVPKMTGPYGVKYGRETIRTIDGLARTIYGEMASCVKVGLQYPYGVGAVIRNRMKIVRCKNRRRQQYQPPSKYLTAYEEAISSNKQFSVWNKGSKYAKNTLCPDAKSKAWEESLRTAKLMVLHPQKFDAATRDDFKCVDHYVSGAVDNAWTREYTEIRGGSVSSSKCMRRFVPAGTNLKTCEPCKNMTAEEQMTMNMEFLNL